MSNWMNDALTQLTERLPSIGDALLSQDLAQIAEFLRDSEDPPQRHPDGDLILDNILESANEAEYKSALQDFCTCYQIDHYALNVIDDAFPITPSKRLVTNYPESWITEYIENNYFYIDPIIMNKSLERYYFWDSIKLIRDDPITKHFWIRAQINNISDNGVTLQDIAGGEVQFQFHISSPNISDIWKHYKCDIKKVFCFAINQFKFLFFKPAHINKIGPKQVEFLKLHASGINPNSIGLVFGSPKAIESSIHEALGTKSIVQAVIAAERLGILQNTPFRLEELVSLETNPNDNSSC